jgi:hypothetical protein
VGKGANLYNADFYKDRHRKTLYSARTILGIVREMLPEIRSAVDMGCGVGTWLSVLKEGGATDIRGIDGPWVVREYLEIPEECFTEHDLSSTITLDTTFDLAISLEVAEHLPAVSARGFVESLTGFSDFILFSAATPHQIGIGHINEQWPNYWISLFEERGYAAVDIVRKRIWNDESIPSWYRQNILLFVKRERCGDIRYIPLLSDLTPPEVYLLTFAKLIAPSVKEARRTWVEAVKRRINRSFPSLFPGNS